MNSHPARCGALHPFYRRGRVGSREKNSRGCSTAAPAVRRGRSQSMRCWAVPRLQPLRDRVAPGLRVLFVGINPGIRSATTGHHFAGYSNRFWKLLFASGLIPEPIGAEDDARLLEWGYGITNLVPRPTPGIDK